MAATLLACSGAVLAQATEVENSRSAGRQSASQQPTLDHIIPGHYIVVLDGDTGEQRATQNNGQNARAVANQMAQEHGLGVSHTYSKALKGFAAQIPEDELSEVKNDPHVDFVVPDREVQASVQQLPTGINRVDADLSTNSVQAGNGSGAVNVDIAIIDSGIYTKHVDLNVVGGTDCSTDGKNTFSDDNGHGTHAAGSAAAEDNTTGVVGTAPGARLWSVKVLDSKGGGSFAEAICGVDWVTGTRTDSDTTNDVEVANMSLGGTVSFGNADDGNCGNTNDDPLHQAICASVAAGVTYVVAAGNDTIDVQHAIPASYNEVITVSALADYNGLPNGGAFNTCFQDSAVDDDFAFFSNFATLATDRAHMMGAPGVCINSTWKGSKKKKKGAYKTISGTSMASPHVAGAAAVYKANKNPNATPAQVMAFMRNSANSEAVNQGHTDIFGLSPEPVLQMDNY
jgi:subtilisin family serine protease